MHCGFGPFNTYYQFAGAARSLFGGCRWKHISEILYNRFVLIETGAWEYLKASVFEAPHLIYVRCVLTAFVFSP
jgi:hypothetical protein